MDAVVLPQSEARQLGILRSARREPALVQKKLAGRHATKLQLRQSGQIFLQPGEGAVRKIFFLLARRTRPSAASRQGQVSMEGMVFLWNTESSQGFIHGL